MRTFFLLLIFLSLLISWHTSVANDVFFAFSKVFKDIYVIESEDETEVDNVKDIFFDDIFDFDEQEPLLAVEGEYLPLQRTAL